MTIRKFPENPVTLEQLITWESLTQEAAQFLKTLVKCKYNIFVSGGTGSGKTTFLNALSQYIPADERVITIEDSAELQIKTVPNLVSMETRNANTEGKGEITIRELIRSSLRMRPNRIIVGEVRGVEALDMLAAMNTGHDGSFSSGHSNSTKDMISRLETMVLSGADLPLHVVRQQITSAVDIIVHLSRLRDRTRRVVEIVEMDKLYEGEVIINPLYLFQEEGEQDGKIQGKLLATGNLLIHQNKLRMAGISEREYVAMCI
jgi:pilus assembly protein CpaF